MIRFAARRDPCLQDLRIPLAGATLELRADLRESVFTPLYRFGCIPHQLGFDLLWKRMLRPGDVVFDVGANIGYTTALFSDLVGKHGRVIAIEPSPRAFQLLSRSFKDVPNVELFNFGLSDAEGTAEIFVPEFLDQAALIHIPGAYSTVVAVTTLDEVFRRHGPANFIKLDVEGHEASIFRGAARSVGGEPRPVVVFEALDQEHLARSLGVLSEASSGGYRYSRIRNDGALVALDDKEGTSDFVAIPEWAEARMRGE